MAQFRSRKQYAEFLQASADRRAENPVPVEPPPGEERCIEYYSGNTHGWLVHYTYRSADGVFYACTAPDVETARLKRDAWFQAGLQL